MDRITVEERLDRPKVDRMGTRPRTSVARFRMRHGEGPWGSGLVGVQVGRGSRTHYSVRDGRKEGRSSLSSPSRSPRGAPYDEGRSVT